MVSTLATIISLVGIYLCQKVPEGSLGVLGFLVSLAGNLLLFFPNPAIGGSVFALVLVILGIAALRADTLPQWASGVWVFSPIIAVLGFVFP